MKPLVLDKIGSVTNNCRLDRDVKISPDIVCEEGSVVAVRILTSKSTYNQLELPSGRFSHVKPGDIIAGALGHRKALFGYSGHVPTTLAPGDKINVLNLGGVLGICDAINPDLGRPFECEVLGQILAFPYLGRRVGIPAHIGQGALPIAVDFKAPKVPVIAVVGSCMNAGKTAAACSLVQAFTHRGLRVSAGKATGVSLRRDVLAMEDSGAKKIAVFTDLGIVTTTPQSAPIAARTILAHLAADHPDIIVLELGDGLLGLYGVDTILDDPEVKASFAAVVLAANDPVAAWGGVRLLDERHGLPTTVVTGPATDNTAGSKLVEDKAGVAAINARSDAERLADCVLAAVDARKNLAKVATIAAETHS